MINSVARDETFFFAKLWCSVKKFNIFEDLVISDLFTSVIDNFVIVINEFIFFLWIFSIIFSIETDDILSNLCVFLSFLCHKLVTKKRFCDSVRVEELINCEIEEYFSIQNFRRRRNRARWFKLRCDSFNNEHNNIQWSNYERRLLIARWRNDLASRIWSDHRRKKITI